MSEFLVAYFHTQRDAVTSARKLQTCGVQRERMAIHGPRESATDDGLARAAPAVSVPSHALQAGAFTDVEPMPAEPVITEPRAIEPAEIPGLAASTTLTITLNDRPPIDDVCTVLKDAGAYLIDVTERNIARQYPDM
jgi:hypothetical protein